MQRLTSKAILKALGHPRLSLHRGEGYWYFVYDSPYCFETNSVYVMRLSDLSFESWLAEGRSLIEKAEAM